MALNSVIVSTVIVHYEFIQLSHLSVVPQFSKILALSIDYTDPAKAILNI